MTEQSPVEAIFFAALEKGTPEDRVAYLDAACGDDSGLRQRVERLLAAHPQVGSFLEPLRRSDQINKALFQGSYTADLAFLAMTQQQLGHAKEAQAELQRLRERMKAQRWVKDDEAQGFLREAEALLAKPKAPRGK